MCHTKLNGPLPEGVVQIHAQAPLAEAVDEAASFLPTAAPPEGFPAEDGGYMGHGSVVLVGGDPGKPEIKLPRGIIVH